MTFLEKLTFLLNEFSWDAKTDTADFILAEEVELFLSTKIVPEDPDPEGPVVETPTTPPTPPTGD